MKGYTFEEVIANIKVGETYECTDRGYTINRITKDNVGIKFNNNEPPRNSCGTSNSQRFFKVEESVSFIESVGSDKRIKCVHSNFVSTDKFMTIPEMLNSMSRYSRPIELIEIGKWYIED